MSAIGSRECPKADRVAFELMPPGLIAADVLKSGSTGTLQSAVKSRPVEMRVAGHKTIVHGKLGVAPVGHDNSLFSLGENGRTGLLWPRLPVFNRRPFAPLGDRLRVRRENDPPDRFLTFLTPESSAQLRERSILPSE